MEKNEQIDKLNKLVLESDKLDELVKLSGGINFFTILNIEDWELKHSNMLAWLLDREANHKLGDKFFKKFIKKIIENNPEKNIDIKKWLLYDLNQIEILIDKPFKTDKSRIDILIILEYKNEKYLIAIENKVNSSESKGQTKKYTDLINKEFKDYKNKLFVFLTANGDEPEDTNWHQLTYREIYKILEEITKDIAENNPKTEQAFIINSYKNLLEKKYMKNDEIQQLCKEIFEKHKEAIKLIMDNITSEKNMIAEAIIEKLKSTNNSNIIYSKERSKATNTYLRFNTKTMDDFIPQLPQENSSWNTKDTYYYWFSIKTKKKKVKLIFELGGDNLPDDIKQIHNSIIDNPNFKNKKNKLYKYKRIWTEPFNINENLSIDENVNIIIEKSIKKINEQETKIFKAKPIKN